MTISQSFRLLLTPLTYIHAGDAEVTRFSGELGSYGKKSPGQSGGAGVILWLDLGIRADPPLREDSGGSAGLKRLLTRLSLPQRIVHSIANR